MGLYLGLGIAVVAACLWLTALFLPSVSYKELDSEKIVIANGGDCFLYTLLPMLWIIMPQVFIPLLSTNASTFAAVTFLFALQRRLGIWLPIWTWIAVPSTMATNLIAEELFSGFYLWRAALVVMALAVTVEYITKATVVHEASAESVGSNRVATHPAASRG
jgi:hypothetical protein